MFDSCYIRYYENNAEDCLIEWLSSQGRALLFLYVGEVWPSYAMLTVRITIFGR